MYRIVNDYLHAQTNNLTGWLLWYYCLTYVFTINVLWLFLTVSWVGLQCVIVIFPDHTHLLFDHSKEFDQH